MRAIDRIIVHHSDSLFGDAKWIRATQVDPKRPAGPLPDLAYHYIIGNGWLSPDRFERVRDGLVETGLELAKPGYHDKGENASSIGICLIGRNLYTPAQIFALHGLVSGLRAGQGRPVVVRGHCEDEPPGTPTACPGTLLAPRLDELRAFLDTPSPYLAAIQHEALLRAVCVPGEPPPWLVTAPTASRS